MAETITKEMMIAALHAEMERLRAILYAQAPCLGNEPADHLCKICHLRTDEEATDCLVGPRDADMSRDDRSN